MKFKDESDLYCKPKWSKFAKCIQFISNFWLIERIQIFLCMCVLKFNWKFQMRWSQKFHVEQWGFYSQQNSKSLLQKSNKSAIIIMLETESIKLTVDMLTLIQLHHHIVRKKIKINGSKWLRWFPKLQSFSSQRYIH